MPHDNPGQLFICVLAAVIFASLTGSSAFAQTPRFSTGIPNVYHSADKRFLQKLCTRELSGGDSLSLLL
jgi:hypothetical protein